MSDEFWQGVRDGCIIALVIAVTVLLGYCISTVHAEQLVTIRTTPASLLECTAKMLKAGDPRALLGPVACAEWSATACEVILPAGVMAALPLLMAMGPDAVLAHELAHCTEHDYHSTLFPWIDK